MNPLSHANAQHRFRKLQTRASKCNNFHQKVFICPRLIRAQVLWAKNCFKLVKNQFKDAYGEFLELKKFQKNYDFAQTFSYFLKKF